MGAADRSAILDAIYAAAVAPERWPDTIGLIADHLGASGGMIAFYPQQPGRRFIVTGRLRDDLLMSFAQHYADNHWSDALRKLPFGAPTLVNTLVDEAALRRSGFFADILAPQRIEDMVAVTLPSLSEPGGSGGISFTLTARQRDEAHDVTRRVEPLVEHLARAIDLSLELGRQLARTPALEQALQALSGAALLVDHHGAIAFANAAAEHLLTEADGLFVRRSDPFRLAASDSREDRALNKALASSIALSLRRGQDWTGSVRIKRPSGRPSLVVLTTPLLAPFHPFGPALLSKACVLVQIVGATRAGAGVAVALSRRYGLTAAQARVAVLVGQGLPVPGAARALGLSPTTVKTHLGQCFEKLEIRSQVDLARIVATLPPVRG